VNTWEPIDNAPKDGRAIRAKSSYTPSWPRYGRTRYYVRYTRWVGGAWLWGRRGEKWEPTHWKPEPADRIAKAMTPLQESAA